jgi:enamine deaminase RidA (YjgF/YER057c/UK114 family)
MPYLWLLAIFLRFCALADSGLEPACNYIEPDSKTGTSKAVIPGQHALVHTMQILAVDGEGALVANADARAQTERVLLSLGRMLEAAESELGWVVKLNIYISSSNSLDAVHGVLARQFPGASKPAASFVVTPLPIPGALVAMDAVTMTRLQVRERNVKWISMPGEIERNGSNAAAVPSSGPLIYVSGMADTNGLPEATRITLGKLMSAIAHLGLGKSDVVQLKAFFQPMSEVAVVRKVIVDFFQSNAPPTVFVEWTSPAPNPPIEIELVAAGKASEANESDSVEFLTPTGTTSTKVFSRVAKVNRGKLIYISGLYGVKARDADAEVREIFQSLGNILESSGSDFEHLVKATYYVSDDLAGNKLNDIRPQFFNPLRPPAASKAKVRGVGVPDKTVTLDMIAVTK